jgi:hypothetical protein
MNKKILIGSILAVVILVSVSFSSVVGYNKLTSNVFESPLFKIRTSRAIDAESQDLSCGYIGKDEEISIMLPSYNSRDKQLNKVIDFIRGMDDKTFNSYLNLLINKIRNNEKCDEVNMNEVITSIQQIRNNPQPIILDEPNKDNIDTIGYDFAPTVCWFPGCTALLILEQIIFIFIAIVWLYAFLFLDWTSTPEDCGYSPT